MDLVIVTGLSGAGRRSVLNALEDTGAATLDSIPPELLQPLLALRSQLAPNQVRLAVGLDNRDPSFTQRLLPVLDHLRESGQESFLVFVEATDGVLVRRYSETRRPHFLAEGGNLARAVTQERMLLAPIRARANAILDTSGLTLSQLRQRVADLLPGQSSQDTVLRLLSFGFKNGVPQDADMVLDARFLPNPHYEPELRPLTGRDAPVREWLMRSDDFQTFLVMLETWVRWAWPMVKEEGRAYHTVAIGCTGGQHRSVALVELLAERLADEVPGLAIQHRELG